MKKLLICIGLLLSLAFNVAPAAAQQRKEQVSFKDMTLKNGLRVLLVEDHSAPIVAVDVTYNVGSRDEVKGRTGFTTSSST